MDLIDKKEKKDLIDILATGSINSRIGKNTQIIEQPKT